MSEDEKSWLIDNPAHGLSAVSRPDIIERSLNHFRKADADYGARLATAVRKLRPENTGAEVTVQTGEADSASA